MSKTLPLIPEFFERFIQNWADKRHPNVSNEFTVNNRLLYILPTRHGITYFVILILILFGSINYENNLGYILAFLLGSLGFLDMIYTHQNINQLTIKMGQAEPVFCGQKISFPIYISQTSTALHANLKLLSNSGNITNTQLINEKNTSCSLQLNSKKRGYISANRIKLFSEYPLGLFHAWCWLNFDGRCLVYPMPAAKKTWLKHTHQDANCQSKATTQGVDDFAGIRQYQQGDLANHMAWKAIAKTGELQTKHYNGEASKSIWIDWNQTSESLNMENRLSILCRMILDAEEKNIRYGFKTPTHEIAPSLGFKHKHLCLKSLALFGH